MNDSGFSEAPFLHEASGTVRFWVLVDGHMRSASIGREALHYRYRPTTHGEDPLETFGHHSSEIMAAASRRYAEGAREPVMLREFDLRAQGPQGTV